MTLNAITRHDNQLESHIDGIRAMSVRGFQSVTVADWDSIDITYPSDTTELFTYAKGSTTIATVLVTYTDNTKASLLKVERG
jgi:hypothetical protein